MYLQMSDRMSDGAWPVLDLNYEAAQWKHKAVWNRRYMEAKRGQELIQMWNEHEIDTRKERLTPMRSRQTMSSGQRALRPSNRQPTYLTVSSLGH